MTAPARRPRLAVWKFASCDGCQLSLLDCEDELLDVADALEIGYFLEASRATVAGPYDLSLVEGSITTPGDAQRIREVRAASRYLVTIGACATSGGIQALRNFGDVEEYRAVVYASPEFVSTLDTSTGIAEHVPVDFELRGCPIAKSQLLEVIAQFGRREVRIIFCQFLQFDSRIKRPVKWLAHQTQQARLRYQHDAAMTPAPRKLRRMLRYLPRKAAFQFEPVLVAARVDRVDVPRLPVGYALALGATR